MDDVNRFARELADAIAAAVAANPEVEACRERARAAGFEMRVSLEAVVGFMSRENREGREREGREKGAAAAVTKVSTPARLLPPQRTFDITANDRRFLRSLRIAADATPEEVN
jgi:hypothetical protein